MERNNKEALILITRLLHDLVVDIYSRDGVWIDILIVGDFNWHDQLWGRDQISLVRQREAEVLVDYITKHSL